MSGENTELVRRVAALFNEVDVDAALDFAADDFVMDWSNSIGPLRGVYEGHDGVRDLFDAFSEAWEEIKWEPLEITELDDDHVLVVNHVRMRGKGSGVEVDATGAQIWTLRDGVGRRITLYQSKAEALEATGLA
jgi:ketosteroid isomerase-like protein